MCIVKLEDIKGVIRRCTSKDRQRNGQREEKTKTKHYAENWELLLCLLKLLLLQLCYRTYFIRLGEIILPQRRKLVETYHYFILIKQKFEDTKGENEKL